MAPPDKWLIVVESAKPIGWLLFSVDPLERYEVTESDLIATGEKLCAPYGWLNCDKVGKFVKAGGDLKLMPLEGEGYG